MSEMSQNQVEDMQKLSQFITRFIRQTNKFYLKHHLLLNLKNDKVSYTFVFWSLNFW